MRAPLYLAIALLASSLFGCGRYSYRIRNAYARGNYGMAASRCQGDALAAETRWTEGHRARYHVYCGMTFLTMGDSARAASELVQAERLRIAQPRILTGRDLEQLDAGLIQLFGVPSGQLLIEQQTGAVVASEAVSAAPQSSAKLVAPGTSEGPAIVVEAPAVGAERAAAAAAVTLSAAASAPEAPSADASAAVTLSASAPEPVVEAGVVPAPAPSPPVIVIPEEDGAVIE